MAETSKVQLSIVIPTYNEEQNVLPLYSELREVLDSLGKHFEIIFVNDGSTDNTLDILKGINKKDKRVQIINFRKNFGQTAAMDAGFKHARGDVIISIDSDMQNDPRDIPRLLEKIGEGYDVVVGWRFYRKDPLLKKLFSRCADKLRRFITKEKIHDAGCTLKAFKRECFEDLDLYGEMHRFIPALLLWKGFKVTEIKVAHRPRVRGKTKYTISRLFKGFLDLIAVKFWMQYSARPVHLFGGLGLLTGFLGFLIGLYLTILKVFYNQPIGNRPLLILSALLMILGVQFLMVGLLADIAIKIYFRENKPYKIKEIIR